LLPTSYIRFSGPARRTKFIMKVSDSAEALYCMCVEYLITYYITHYSLILQNKRMSVCVDISKPCYNSDRFNYGLMEEQA
jgi:hypothetical protein